MIRYDIKNSNYIVEIYMYCRIKIDSKFIIYLIYNFIIISFCTSLKK